MSDLEAMYKAAEYDKAVIMALFEKQQALIKQLVGGLKFYYGDENEGYSAWKRRMLNDMGEKAQETLQAAKEAGYEVD